MKKSTFRIISGITTIVATAAVTIVTVLVPQNSAVISGIVVAVAGAIDEVCTLFIKEVETSKE